MSASAMFSTGSQAGAEHFSYDLTMLKRATLVGETTADALATAEKLAARKLRKQLSISR